MVLLQPHPLLYCPVPHTAQARAAPLKHHPASSSWYCMTQAQVAPVPTEVHPHALPLTISPPRKHLSRSVTPHIQLGSPPFLLVEMAVALHLQATVIEITRCQSGALEQGLKWSIG
jgi:hypothetical protein